ncbi:MAG: hypothetical protein KGL39_32565 [Patescibacteria group bacterium]|nr:hypothetical protein [Patescibacteria group bacterium]
MLIQNGSAAVGGPFAETEYAFRAAQITLANGATLATGQVVCRDLTKISGGSLGGSTGSTNSVTDQVVLPTSADAGLPYGVYQDAAITNSTGQTQTYTLKFLWLGYGQVLATSPAAGNKVNVDSVLVISADQIQCLASTAALGVTIGQALATGVSVNPGTQLLSSASGVVNADIMIR